jgi:hypothetical protein
MPTAFDTRRAPGIRSAPPELVYRAALAATACTAILVTAINGLAAATWIGRSFPGFFVLPNRVIPSVGRDVWPASGDGALYQRTIVAIDGKSVATNADAYREIGAEPLGSPVTYTLRDGVGVATVTLATRRFSSVDYWIIFGSYLATGLLYLCVGVLAAWLLPEASLGRALLMLGGAGGIFALTGASIYQPGADLRIHAVAEAFFPATLVYLALVVARVEQGRVAAIGAIAWWTSLALAVTYQLVLGTPGPYTLVHNACQAYMGLAGFAFGATIIVERARVANEAGPLLRATVAGTLLGIGVPAVVMALSGLSGGAVPVNLVTATAFLFPLSIAYGLLRERVTLGRPVSVAA